MYKKALQDLISKATEEFFEEHTEYKEVACYKVEFRTSKNHIAFTARLVACDKEPHFGEWFDIEGYICYHIEFTKIVNTVERTILYNAFN